MSYKLLIQYSIWPKGVVMVYHNGMYREFKDAIVGISVVTMDLLIKKKYVEEVK